MSRPALTNRNSTGQWICFLKVAALCGIAVTIAGCGVSATPSESDVKNQIKDAFKNCQSVELGDFKKINGVAVDEGLYVVSAKFTMRTSPVSEVAKLVKAAIERRAEIEIQGKALQDQIQQFNIENMEISKKRDEVTKNFTEVEMLAYFESPEGIAIDKKKAELVRHAQELQNSSLMREYMSSPFNINSAPQFPTNPYQVSASERVTGTYFNTCKLPESRFINDLWHKLYHDQTPFIEKSEMEFTADIKMIKTDNGWVMQDLWRK